MTFIELDRSPLRPNVSPVQIYYRESGKGIPLVFLHGGWGYEIFPFDRQIAEFSDRFRILIPDRSGYGRSGRIAQLPRDFHHLAAVETIKFLDALEIQRAILWGHSDGAVIAALLGLAIPQRLSGLVLEAFHFYRVKLRSRDFFETMMSRPKQLGERVVKTLAREHGEEYWETVMQIGGSVWLEIADTSRGPEEDLYDGKLSNLKVPALFIHGGTDPRTEPGELAAVQRQLPAIPIHIIDGAGHSPHSEMANAVECNKVASAFLAKVSD